MPSHEWAGMQVGRVRVRPVDVLALASVALLLAVGHYLVPHWATTYGAYLLAFAIWMAWFVERGAGVLKRPGK